jgi:hypothetical protein
MWETSIDFGTKKFGGYSKAKENKWMELAYVQQVVGNQTFMRVNTTYSSHKLCGVLCYQYQTWIVVPSMFPFLTVVNLL